MVHPDQTHPNDAPATVQATDHLPIVSGETATQVGSSPLTNDRRHKGTFFARFLLWVAVAGMLLTISRSPVGQYRIEWIGRAVAAISQPVYRHSDDALRPFTELTRQLEPLATRMHSVQPGEWLSEHPELRQSFLEFVRSQREPVKSRVSRIYLVPLGEFTPTQERLLAETRDFVGAYFGMETVCLDVLRNIQVPANARRLRSNGTKEQWLAPHLMQHDLLPVIPEDAACIIGLTATDLWAGPGSNFLFGLADPDHRVGVWSIARNGNPDGSDIEYRRTLRRTLKIAVHEIGHLFGIDHCTAYECCMNGANHAEESDAQPIEYCPECLPKLCWTCQQEPTPRIESLILFAESTGLNPEAALWRKMLSHLKAERSTK